MVITVEGRQCGPRHTKKNNAYKKEELIEMGVARGAKKSELMKLKMDELCRKVNSLGKGVPTPSAESVEKAIRSMERLSASRSTSPGTGPSKIISIPRSTSPGSAPRASPVKSMDELKKMKVDDLKSLMSRRGISQPSSGSGKGGRIVKGDLISAILDHQARSSGASSVTITKKRVSITPTKITIASEETLKTKKVAELRKILRDLLKDHPTAKKTMPTTKQALINRIVEMSTAKHVSPKRVSPKKKAARRAAKCTDKEDPLECPDDKVCSATSGRCIGRTNLDKKWKLRIDGRLIVGTEKVIRDLRDVLGGEIEGPGGPSPKRKTPSPKTPSPKRKTPSPVAEPLAGKSRDEIYKKFLECLS